MAVITPPLPTTPSPRIQTPTPRAGTERTVSSSSDEEEINNSRLLDNFLLESRRNGTTSPTHHLVVVPEAAAAAAANNTTAPSSNPFINASMILNLPLSIIRQILRYLLASPSPLILRPDPSIIASRGYRTCVEPSVLQVCRVFHNVGLPILYGENTLTTSSPATSFDFDDCLLSLRGSKRQMITSVRLEIDWADGLWAKFPLVARALGELKGLRKVEVEIVGVGVEEEEKRMVRRRGDDGMDSMMIDEDAKMDVELKYVDEYGREYPRQGKIITTTAPLRTATVDGRVRREGPVVAGAMLKAEMKMLRDLVTGIKNLECFRLRGFRNEGFARCLEEYVRMGNQ